MGLLVLVTSLCGTLALAERQSGNPLKKKKKKKKGQTNSPSPVALTGVNNDRAGTFPLPLSGLSGASGHGSTQSTHTNTPLCQRDSCHKGSFRSNGYDGSEPTEHTAGHPAGRPGFGD